jgi:hypothetical protein
MPTECAVHCVVPVFGQQCCQMFCTTDVPQSQMILEQLLKQPAVGLMILSTLLLGYGVLIRWRKRE